LSVLLAVIAFATLASCDKLPLTAPTESIITLNVSTTVVPVNGSAEIIASVTEPSGTPAHNGTVVTFTSSFGTIEPREAQTSAGKATVRFIGSSQSGTARIGAFSGSSRAEEIEILVGAAAAANVVLRAQPATVPATGGTVDIIATVIDASGNPLPGAPVVFSANNGSLESSVATTGPDGRAQTRLTTNLATIVTARAGARDGTVTVGVTSLPIAAITSSTTNPTVGVPVAFSVAPPATSAAPLQNVIVDFGDGSPNLVLGAITGATGFTHTFGSEGGFTVTATAIDVNGLRGTSSVAIVVTRSLPGVTITAAPPSVVVGAAVTFTVIVAAPPAGAPAITSVQVVQVNSGQVVFSGTAGGSFIRTFGAPGIYTFQATVTDRTGSVGTSSVSVNVTP
jgi:adhesin/invasin